MKGLINESIRVSVCCSPCVSGMQSGPDVPSLRAHRGKGCHCWQAWWMGGTPRHDKDECDSPRPAKGGRCSTTEGRSCDADHLPLPSYIPYWLSPRWWKIRRGEISDHPIEWLPHSHILSIKQQHYRHGGPNYTVYCLWSKWWEITNTSLNWEQYLIKALDKITGLNKHKGIHQ